MRAVMRRRLRAASLVEALVAAAVLLTVFVVTMELVPRLTDGLAVAEAEYRVAQAFDKYGSGLWPAGQYVERYDGSELTIHIEPYRELGDVQFVTIRACIDGSRKRIVHRQLVVCAE